VVTKISFEDAKYISPSFIVRKKPGPDGVQKWRKIVDCRRVNSEQIVVHFRIDTPETVQQVVQQGDWATSRDLKSAFNHLKVHADMRPFLCFAYGRECY
jgi:hypothetical protein